MPVVLHKLPCNFVGSFKVGDNIVYNADVLCKLAEANTDHRLNKMIVLQVGSILEAALSEIIFRAQNYHRDGVSPDEKKAFSRASTSRAMDLNLSVLTHLDCKFARPKHIQGNVQPFWVPTGFP